MASSILCCSLDLLAFNMYALCLCIIICNRYTAKGTMIIHPNYVRMYVCTYRTLNTDVNFIVTFHAVILKSSDNKINIRDAVNIPESVFLQHSTLTNSHRYIVYIII